MPPDQLVAELKALAPLASLIKAVPPVVSRRRQRGAGTEQRATAYASLQRGALDCQTYMTWLAAFQPIYRSWGGLSYRPHLLRTMDGLRGALNDLLSALTLVRMVGLPEARAAAEQMVARTASLQEAIPTARKGATRDRQMAEFDALASALGTAHRDFTLVARRDLGYDRRLRRHRWELWRPRAAPAWPGGWPVRALDEDKE
jgi:hypothetical protein